MGTGSTPAARAFGVFGHNLRYGLQVLALNFWIPDCVLIADTNTDRPPPQVVAKGRQILVGPAVLDFWAAKEECLERTNDPTGGTDIVTLRVRRCGYEGDYFFVPYCPLLVGDISRRARFLGTGTRGAPLFIRGVALSFALRLALDYCG